MKKLLFVLLMVLFQLSASVAQKDGLKQINKNDIRSYMDFLASDEMKGRETSRPENDIAAVYLATTIERLGLKPMPGSESYLQKVPFISRSVMKDSSFISASTTEGTSVVKTDSIISLIPPSTTIEASGELVFAGYGVKDTTINYNDFNNIDVAGKIVLIMTRNPKISNDPKYADGYRFSESIEVPKMMPLFSKRPKAVLLVYDAKNHFRDPYSSGLADMLGGSTSVSLAERPGMGFPIKLLFITGCTADRLLSPSGKTLRQLQDMIDSEKKPSSFLVKDLTVSFKYAMRSGKFNGNNVVGLIEGSDPLLKNECVVYSAHFDHLGVNGKGEVFNGADDNASGTVGLLEVADAFAHLGKKPLRTSVFVWVTGEEKGLLGSQYYVNHPAIAMDKTVLDINLDMIGRSVSPADTGLIMGVKPDVTAKNEIMVYNDITNAKILQIMNNSASKTGITVIDKGKNLGFGGSDHMSFSSKKVPFLFFHSGIHKDLHAIGDDVDKIDYDKMEKVSKTVFMVGYQVANSKDIVKQEQAK